MKAITVKQPWASLIVEGIKYIENRTWKCPEKYIGQRVLIHSGQTQSKFGWTEMNQEQIREACKNGLTGSEFCKLPFGSIIGSVEIVDCVINHPSIWAEKTNIPTIGDVIEDIHFLGMVIPPNPIIYNWVLAKPVKFDKPIPCKGKLGFWDVDESILKQIL